LEAQDQERHSTYGKLSTLLNQQKQKNKEFTWDDDIPNIWKNKHVPVTTNQPTVSKLSLAMYFRMASNDFNRLICLT
jgi:translation initiation factor 2 alpha subunit (eIF-2alpha)